jgi:lipid-A-disaccharide synthase
MLPVMLKATVHFPDHQFIIAGTPSQDPGFYEKFMTPERIPVVYDQTYPLLSFAEAALVTSGTATLETALFKVPQVVCYRAGAVSYQIVKRLVNIRYISTVNLIMDQPVVEELIQHDLSPANLTRALGKLLSDSAFIEKQKNRYQLLEGKLEGPGASDRAAERMVQLLQV